MFRMICLNLDKKLSFLSVVFMMISIFLIFLITVVNASFDLNDYQLLSNEKIVVSNFFFESFQITEIIAVVFIILLVELELFYNNENFDCYFVALKGKGKYFMVKILSYLIILFFYTLVVFIGIGIIYLIRFNSIEYINFIFSSFYHYLIYLILYFFVAFFLLLLFKNYFSAIIVFIYYWLGKILELNDEVLLAILPRIYLNIEEGIVSYNTSVLYIFIFIVALFIICRKTYILKDLKLIS